MLKSLRLASRAGPALGEAMKKTVAVALALAIGGAFLLETPAYAGKGATTNSQAFFRNDGKRSKESQVPRRLRTNKKQQTQ